MALDLSAAGSDMTAVFLAVGVDIALVGLGVMFLILLVRRRRKALASSRNVRFLEQQLDRALEQIESSDEDQILAGFQLLTALNDNRSRLRALGRVRTLMDNENGVIARQAATTYASIVSGLERSADRL